MKTCISLITVCIIAVCMLLAFKPAATDTCTGEGQKLVNGICETGRKVWLPSHHAGTRWYCYYEYVFSDGSKSRIYTISGNFPCFEPVD
ncbi:MAG TPA: hypothetical protein VM802_30055 [Chitinophaga sp.]|uniref:hypothetical protein n=1 Tax=Chitinophaga sp. TaxID=1869181 RepID=UPI002BA8CA44|nr:hypothetical protein [Chitinophaga sp.]HVI49149.1 hypothetical protein [Chitinophaga sp.]